ncbi:MAG: DUF1697 domain-containing protein [Gemmatimonadaceae bacterium]
MTTHIALVRGINVGGHRQVGMTDLRNFLAALGMENVRSLLQSGNLVFESKVRTGSELERFLESEALDRLSLEADFIVRTPDEWKAIIRQNPFRKEAEKDSGHLVVMFLKSEPDVADIVALQGDIRGREVVRAKGKHAYIYFPDGQGRSKLTHSVLEKRLGRGTGRNWNTILKLGIVAKTGSARLTPIVPRRKISPE